MDDHVLSKTRPFRIKFSTIEEGHKQDQVTQMILDGAQKKDFH